MKAAWTYRPSKDKTSVYLCNVGPTYVFDVDPTLCNVLLMFCVCFVQEEERQILKMAWMLILKAVLVEVEVEQMKMT